MPFSACILIIDFCAEKHERNRKKKLFFLGKSSSIRAGQGIVFFKNILVFEKSTVFPIEKLSQAFASPLPCGQGIVFFQKRPCF